MAASANRLEVINPLRRNPTHVELEQRKLERLRELRAVIDDLRAEQACKDPLLAWVIEQENTGNP